MTEVSCPSCGAKGRVPPNYPAGASVQCKKCGSNFKPSEDAFEVILPAIMPRRPSPPEPIPDYKPARPERRGFECPYCHNRAMPRTGTKVSQAGWVLFIIMLFSFIGTLFCWIPLLAMKEEYRVCGACGMKLG